MKDSQAEKRTNCAVLQQQKNISYFV